MRSKQMLQQLDPQDTLLSFEAFRVDQKVIVWKPKISCVSNWSHCFTVVQKSIQQCVAFLKLESNSVYHEQIVHVLLEPAVMPSAFMIAASVLPRRPPFGTLVMFSAYCGYCRRNHLTKAFWMLDSMCLISYRVDYIEIYLLSIPMPASCSLR